MRTEIVYDGIQHLPKVYKEVQENVICSQRRVRKRKEDRGQDDNFRLGDHVLMKNIQRKQRKGGNWKRTCWDPMKSLTSPIKPHNFDLSQALPESWQTLTTWFTLCDIITGSPSLFSHTL